MKLTRAYKKMVKEANKIMYDVKIVWDDEIEYDTVNKSGLLSLQDDWAVKEVVVLGVRKN